MTEHSRFSPSASHRWMNCPGSIGLIEALNLPDEPGAAALEGREVHTLVEQSLRFGTVPVFASQEKRDAVAMFVDYVNSLNPKFRWIEKRVDIAGLSVATPVFGTADCIAYTEDDKTLHIVDLKYGRTLVESSSSQLLIYAVGALQSVLDESFPVNRVKCTIVQPRVFHPEGPIRTTTYDPGEIHEFFEALREAVKLVEIPGAPLISGAHCRWCPAAPHCPALKQHAMTIAQQEFDVIPSEINTPPPPSVMPNDVVADLLTKAPILEAWLDSLKTHAYNLLVDGQEVPGFKLAPKRTHRKWASLTDAEAWLAEEGIVSLRKVVVKSPAEIESEAGTIPPELVTRKIEYTVMPDNARASGAQQTRLLTSGESDHD